MRGEARDRQAQEDMARARYPQLKGVQPRRPKGVEDHALKARKPTTTKPSITRPIQLPSMWLMPTTTSVASGNSPFSSSFLKIGSNFGTKKDHEDREHQDADDRQDYWVGDGADDLGLEFFLVFGEVGDAAEHVFEEAALLPGADHADGQLVEGTRVAGHGLGEARCRRRPWRGSPAERHPARGCSSAAGGCSRLRSSGTPEWSRSASCE